MGESKIVCPILIIKPIQKHFLMHHVALAILRRWLTLGIIEEKKDKQEVAVILSQSWHPIHWMQIKIPEPCYDSAHALADPVAK